MEMKMSAIVIGAALGLAALMGSSGLASAQDVQERTIRWGHLNNTDHPVSMGVQKFAESPRGQERRQAEDPRVRGLAARQRDAAAVGAARRHPGDVVGLDHVAANVVKDFGLLDFPFLVGSTAQAGSAGSWRVRQGDDRNACRRRT